MSKPRGVKRFLVNEARQKEVIMDLYHFEIFTTVKFASFAQFSFIVSTIMKLYNKWLNRDNIKDFKPYLAIGHTVFAIQNPEKGTNKEMNCLINNGMFCGWVYEYDKTHSHRRWRYKFLVHKGIMIIVSPNTKIHDVLNEIQKRI